MAFAEIYNKGGTDRTCIINIRTLLAQGFQAPNWTDLRFGWFASLTQAAADDTITGLAEEIGTPPRPQLDFFDRYAIGLSSVAGLFLGYTNCGRPERQAGSIGTSKLVSSDTGIGTTNSNYWRAKNEVSDDYTAMIIDRGQQRAINQGGWQPHFAQANIGTTGPAGYASLLMLRFRRDTPISRVIRMEIPNNVILYTNTPTADILQTNLETFPAAIKQLGPVELSVVPDKMYIYWPFTLSRLRLHCVGFLQAG